MKAKKKIFGITLAVCLVILSIAGTTLAYFTDTDTKESNVFTAGSVSIEFEGDVFVDVTGNAYPGLQIAEAAKVNNTGTEDAYIGVIITLTKDPAAVALPNGEPPVDLETLLGNIAAAGDRVVYSADKCTMYIVKSAAVADGEKAEIFDKIVIPTTWDNAQMANFAGAKISLTAYATQAAGFVNATEALIGAFDTVWTPVI